MILIQFDPALYNNFDIRIYRLTFEWYCKQFEKLIRRKIFKILTLTALSFTEKLLEIIRIS